MTEQRARDLMAYLICWLGFVTLLTLLGGMQ